MPIAWTQFINGRKQVRYDTGSGWTTPIVDTTYNKTAVQSYNLFEGINPNLDFQSHIADNQDDGVINKTIHFGAGGNSFKHLVGSNNAYTIDFGAGNDYFHFKMNNIAAGTIHYNNTYTLNGGEGNDLLDLSAFPQKLQLSDFKKLGTVFINGETYYKFKHVPNNNVFLVKDFEDVVLNWGAIPGEIRLPFSEFWKQIPGSFIEGGTKTQGTPFISP